MAARAALFCMDMDYMQYLSFLPLTIPNMVLTVNGRITCVAHLAVAAISAVFQCLYQAEIRLDELNR